MATKPSSSVVPTAPPRRSEGRRELPLSAFIICQDEIDYLGNCIESLEQCAEIVVVDSGSTDGTIALIERYAAQRWPIRLFQKAWRGYALQKQFALEQCTQPWLLSIDADERLDEAFKEALPRLLDAPPSVGGYRINRRPYLIGHGYTSPAACERFSARVLRQGRGVFDPGQLVHEGIRISGRVPRARRGSFLHYRPLPIGEQIAKENRYSTLKSQQMMQAGRRPRPLRLLVNPPLYFLRLYLRSGLYRCGFPGFIEAMAAAVYSFLAEAKFYQHWAAKKRPVFDDLDASAAAAGGAGSGGATGPVDAAKDDPGRAAA